MTLGADRGALLVYRHGMGTRATSRGLPEPAAGEDWPAHAPEEPEGSPDKGAAPPGEHGQGDHSH